MCIVLYFLRPPSPQAILKLLERFSPTNREEVCQTSLSLLTGPPPPSSHSLAERRLVVQALKLVFATATDEEVPGISATAGLVLLLHLADGDFEVQEMIRGFLTSIGLEDPLGYLTRVMSRLGAEVSQTFVCDLLSYIVFGYTML